MVQTSKVTVYRLITKRTYESEMFRRASRKLGLSQAVFETGGIRRSFNDAEEAHEGGLMNLMKMDKSKVARVYCACSCAYACACACAVL